jgi:hypothetical protein
MYLCICIISRVHIRCSNSNIRLGPKGYVCVVDIFTGKFQDLVSKGTKNKLSGLETDYSSFPRTEKVHPKQCVLISVSTGAFLFFFIPASLLVPSTFAFGQNASAVYSLLLLTRELS